MARRAPPAPPDDRFEPLPGITRLPAFVWRRMSRPARVAVVAIAVASLALIVALAPSIDRSKKERARSEAAEAARLKAQIIERTRREQLPRVARGEPAGSELGARRELVAAAEESIRSDASKRSAAGEFNGPIDRVQCEGYPRSEAETPADEDPARRIGLYACIAVTSDIPATAGNKPGVVGHPYRMRIDFKTGRYAFCKVRALPGELAVRPPPEVQLSPACAG